MSEQISIADIRTDYKKGVFMRIHSSVLLALTLFTLMSAEKTSTPLASIQELRKKFEKTEASKQVPPKTKTIPAQAQQAQKAAPISTIPSISITSPNPNLPCRTIIPSVIRLGSSAIISTF